MSRSTVTLRLSVYPDADFDTGAVVLRGIVRDQRGDMIWTAPGASFENLCVASLKALEAKGYHVDSPWTLWRDGRFMIKVGRPVPATLDPRDVHEALLGLGIAVDDTGSVSFAFGDGRCTVVRTRGEAPTRLNIEEGRG